MKVIHVRPKLAYKLLGTHLQLDPNKVYPAIQARNVSGWEERGLIYVGDENGIMLEQGEYTVVKGYKPPQVDE